MPLDARYVHRDAKSHIQGGLSGFEENCIGLDLSAPPQIPIYASLHLVRGSWPRKGALTDVRSVRDVVQGLVTLEDANQNGA